MDDKQQLELLGLLKRAAPKRANFSKLVVALVLFLNIVFTAIILLIFYATGNEPPALIAAWFGFTGVELWSLATIKKSKIKEKAGNE